MSTSTASTGPTAKPSDIPAEAARYEAAIAEAGGSRRTAARHRHGRSHRLQRARIVARIAYAGQDVDPADPRDNARFFDSVDDVPHHVLTQGLGTILDAGHLVLIATGSAKADAVAAAVEGPVSAFCPASVLQLHPHVTLVVDRAGGSRPQARGLLPVRGREQARLADTSEPDRTNTTQSQWQHPPITTDRPARTCR